MESISTMRSKSLPVIVRITGTLEELSAIRPSFPRLRLYDRPQAIIDKYIGRIDACQNEKRTTCAFLI